MATSLFLAKVFGLYLFIMGIVMLIHRDFIMEAAKSLMEHKGASFLSALITLILGALLVAGHNDWVWGWTVLITLLSWWILIKGTLRLCYPKIDDRWKSIMDNSVFYYGSVCFSILLGAFFIVVGFFYY